MPPVRQEHESSRGAQELLFSVEDDEDEDGADAGGEHIKDAPARPTRVLDGLPPPYPGDEPGELHQVWREHDEIR